ncbi:hypothetical protein Dcar01_01796 [Deinococcus carri]|uniref:AbrB/MazE/SpoVT family DNA-binding domain-containing protein n=1 Tax=Deinococcus carri TaxID=1211323 RepID=A0ABP9W8H7_9DEIO
MEIRLKVRNWGSGRGVLLPKKLLEELKVQPGDMLAGEVRDGQLVLTRAPRYRLRDLLKELQPENQHDVSAEVEEEVEP